MRRAREESATGVNQNQGMNGGPPTVPTDEVPRRRGVKPLMSMRSHPKLAVGIALTFLLLGLPIAWVQGSASYWSVAGIQIFPTYVANLREPQEVAMPSTTQYRQFVQQQVRTISRFDIVEKALEKLPPNIRALWQREGKTDIEGAEFLQQSLVVHEIEDTYLVSIGIEGPQAWGLAETVNTVVETYIETYSHEKLYGSDERIETLQERRKELADAMAKRIEQENELSHELGMTTFESENPTPYDEALGEATAALAAATRERIAAEAALAAETQSAKRIEALPLTAQAESLLSNDHVLGGTKSQFLGRRNELLLELNILGPSHPARRGLEQQIEDIDAEVADVTALNLDRARRMVLEDRQVAAEKTLTALVAAVDRAKFEEKGFQDLVSKHRETASWFSRRYYRGRALREKITEDHAKIAEVDNRIEYLRLEDKAPGLVRLVTPARNSDLPVSGGRKKVFMVFVAAAFAFAIAIPVAIDLIDHRIHAPNDLERLLGFSPIGWQLDRSDGRVESFARDLSRRLAIAIDRDRRRHKVKQLVFTSVAPGDGTTTLALDIAVELGSLGVRTLAVEGNAFKPDPRFQGSKRSRGLIAALEGDPIKELIIRREAGLPDRLPVGNVNEDIHHLRSLERLPSLLETLSDEYDFVVIDAPPVQLSADAEILCQSTDGTMLVVAAEGVWPGQITRAARLIERLAPPVVGTIVNRVKVYDNGGYLTDMLQTHETGELPPDPLIARLLWS